MIDGEGDTVPDGLEEKLLDAMHKDAMGIPPDDRAPEVDSTAEPPTVVPEAEPTITPEQAMADSRARRDRWNEAYDARHQPPPPLPAPSPWAEEHITHATLEQELQVFAENPLMELDDLLTELLAPLKIDPETGGETGFLPPLIQFDRTTVTRPEFKPLDSTATEGEQKAHKEAYDREQAGRHSDAFNAHTKRHGETNGVHHDILNLVAKGRANLRDLERTVKESVPQREKDGAEAAKALKDLGHVSKDLAARLSLSPVSTFPFIRMSGAPMMTAILPHIFEKLGVNASAIDPKTAKLLIDPKTFELLMNGKVFEDAADADKGERTKYDIQVLRGIPTNESDLTLDVGFSAVNKKPDPSALDETQLRGVRIDLCLGPEAAHAIAYSRTIDETKAKPLEKKGLHEMPEDLNV